tara:strand:+ start:1810 stop:3303 length:1494 start_codon:yes stop_codon:yes gene_type:complete
MILLKSRSSFLCVGSGLLVVASMPPWGWWPSAFIGIALLDRLLSGQGAFRRLRRGFLVGLVWALVGTIWMVDLTPAGWAINAIVHASFMGMASLIVPANSGRRSALVGAITLAELGRWSWPFGGVPLATLAQGQAAGPLAPVVRVAGSLLLVALVVAIGVALSALFDGRQATKRSALVIGITSVALIISGVLAALAPEGHLIEEMKVAIVQGGGSQRTRATPSGASVVFSNQVAANQTVEKGVDLILWPENVVNPDPSTTSPLPNRLYSDEASTILSMEARRLDAVLVPGWFIQDDSDPTANLNYSTAIDSTGEVIDRYDKVRIVPFGEFVPLRSLIEVFAADLLPARDVRPGNGPAILETPAGNLGISISWEIFFDHRARDAIKNGGEILINPTNGASYWLTIVQTQQIASSRLRALETGRWVLQAAPTGFSAVINPNGKVIQRTSISEQTVLHATVERRSGLTWAAQVGIWPMAILAVFLILVGHKEPEGKSESA